MEEQIFVVAQKTSVLVEDRGIWLAYMNQILRKSMDYIELLLR
jgi:ABC-type tungstate transport system permease subunit